MSKEWGIRSWLKSWWRRQAIAARWRESRRESRRIVEQVDSVIAIVAPLRKLTHYQCPHCGRYYYDNPGMVENNQRPSERWLCEDCGIGVVNRMEPSDVGAARVERATKASLEFYRRSAEKLIYTQSRKHQEREKRWKAKQSISS